MRTLSDSLFDLSIYLTFFLFIPFFLHFLLLSPSTSLMSWITSPRSSAEELGLSDKKNSTGFEPNDHFITEAYVGYTQESLSE